MTNTVAVYLGLLIAAALALDILANDGEEVLFLGRKFLDLMEWVEFWN